jgi:peptidoglycan/xylan/chitin deacetylase (PgdA/CDA1 family)
LSAIPPVLCCHRIGGPLELGVTRVARSVFVRQMTTLAREGWRTLTLSEFAAHLEPFPVSRFPFPDQVFLLTFDDGYAELAEHAYPVLVDLGLTATTFVITGHVGRTNTWDSRYTLRRLRHLDWPAIEAWRGRGLEFASHTATHPRLTWLDAGHVAEELERSRETLVRRLGRDAGRAVAYPFGASDARIQRLTLEAGYELGFMGARVPRDGAGPLALRRMPVYLWDLLDRPLGLRGGIAGALGAVAARIAGRCAVGTSMMRGIGV